MSALRKPKVVTKDFRPPGAGRGFPLVRELSAQPGAAACRKATPHDVMLAGVSDLLLAGVIADAEKRNLRDYGDHETRWWAERSSAARALRRERKAAGTWSLEVPRKTKPAPRS